MPYFSADAPPDRAATIVHRAVATVCAVAALALGVGLFAAQAGAATRHRLPSVRWLSARAAATSGGRHLVIHGDHLRAVRSVWFGSTRAHGTRVLSQYRLEVVSPRHSAGTVHVRVVTTHGVTQLTRSDMFSYVAPGGRSLSGGQVTPPILPTPPATVVPSAPATPTATPSGSPTPTTSDAPPSTTAPMPTTSASPTPTSSASASPSPLPLTVATEQYYGGQNSASMVSVSNGELVLSAARDGSGGYLSSEVDSNPFTYGTVTVVAKLAAGTGMWPAIWLHADDAPHMGQQEIDMQELAQSRPGETHSGQFSYHWTDSSGSPWDVTTSKQMPYDFTAGFHTFTMTWLPGSITWWVDGEQVAHVESNPGNSTGQCWADAGMSDQRKSTPTGNITIPSQPMHVLINNGVGSPGSWAGSPDTSTPFPNATVIRYISIQPLNQPAMVDDGSFPLN